MAVMKKLIVVLAVLIGAMTVNAQLYGLWRYDEDIDPITDENTSAISRLSTTWPHDYKNSGLVVRCGTASYHSSGVEVYFAAGTDLGSDFFYDFVYRVDKHEPVSLRGSASVSEDAIFFREKDIPDLITALIDGSNFVFRTEDAEGDEITYELPLTGFDEALQALGCYKEPPAIDSSLTP